MNILYACCYSHVHKAPQLFRFLLLMGLIIGFSPSQVKAQLSCNPDFDPPTAICTSEISVDVSGGSAQLTVNMINSGSWDWCDSTDINLFLEIDTLSATPPTDTSVTFDFTDIGTHFAMLWVVDQSGNFSNVMCEVFVVDCQSTPAFPLVCNTGPIVIHLPVSGNPVYLSPDDVLSNPVYSACLPTGASLQLKMGSSGTPTISLEINTDHIGTNSLTVLADQNGGVLDSCNTSISVIPVCPGLPDSLVRTLTGTVFQDTSGDCSLNNEPGLANMPILVEGLLSQEIYQTVTDSNGNFEINICDTLVEISLDLPFNYGQNCPTTQIITFTNGGPQSIGVDIPVFLDPACPIMHVDVGTPLLRRCFENYYSISYYNASDQTIPNAYVEVQLDTFMAYTYSTIPGIALGNNLFSFSLGDLPPGGNGNFQVYFILNCDAPLGSTHCVSASIFPDTLCSNNANWTGADIRVDGYCQNDSTYLTIRNAGAGNMAKALDFIVVEDVIMYMQDSFDLNAAEFELVLHTPGSGSTWYLEAEQEADHPFPGNVSIAIDGCGGVNPNSVINQLPLHTPNPFTDRDCQQNIGSYDPNDKRSFPIGLGSAHFIDRADDLTYQIRFQNTGTDTAFTVVIIDTLSTFLDPNSIQMGASSHDYRFERLDGNILQFTFDDILLPDSNVNELASHGFIQFLVKQSPDNPLGTIIENNAAIYFDFNDPIITNTVFHTIGEDFIQIITGTKQPSAPGALKVYPNPAYQWVNFDLQNTSSKPTLLQVRNMLGQLIHQQPLRENPFFLDCSSLNAGTYIYTVSGADGEWYSGTILIR